MVMYKRHEQSKETIISNSYEISECCLLLRSRTPSFCALFVLLLGYSFLFLADHLLRSRTRSFCGMFVLLLAYSFLCVYIYIYTYTHICIMLLKAIVFCYEVGLSHVAFDVLCCLVISLFVYVLCY